MAQKLSVFKVAAAYIGTVVGAGFATGQEILQYFGYFGFWGFGGLAIATLLFIYFGYLIMKTGQILQADSHLPVVRYAGGKWISVILDYVITFFLFGALTIMAAGAGALFHEQLGLSSFWGTLMLTVATLATVFFGLNGVISAISFFVPLLLASIIGVCIYTVATAGISPQISEAAINAGNPAVPFWPVAAVVYTSYNLVLAIAVLAPMGKQANSKETIKKGAIWGGIGLGLGALAIFLSILLHMPQAARFEIPMVYAAGSISPIVPLLYALLLFAEIYTTAVGSLYGFVARFTKPQSRQLKILALAISGLALAAAQFGFTRLVRILFPLFGYAGLLLMGGMIVMQLKPYLKKTRQRLTPQPAMKKWHHKRE